MSTAIAFLSGKGGSGKTTLALSMADLLCRCGVQTLLVDCDLSTNGATYFYESQLVAQSSNNQSNVSAFNDLLNMESFPIKPIPLKVGSKLDFIPSISNISSQLLGKSEMWSSNGPKIQLDRFLQWARQSYDVILFDCQAGYTELLPVLLPLMDVDLFVLEADSISASAMRNLHLKIGTSFGSARLYQIFNKATPEEFDIYSKIVGTFFINIGTLLFDWKIRQAFSRSQTPDLENTSAKFGSDLCNICKIIFADRAIQGRLEQFLTHLHYQQLEEARNQTADKLHNLYNLSTKSHRFQKSFLLMTYALIIIAGIFLLIQSDFLGENSLYWKTSSTMLPIIAVLLSTLLGVITAFYVTETFQETRKERQNYERKLKDIDKELEKLDRLQQRNAND